MRKSCEECPYKVKSNHNIKFIEAVNKLHSFRKTKLHTCHMIGNVWDKYTSSNVCIGSLNGNK